MSKEVDEEVEREAEVDLKFVVLLDSIFTIVAV